jgi:glycosyltransferase involved in cell wall biosynthesis
MQITYFSKTSEIGPSSRYRIYQFLPYLEAGGVSVTIRPLFGIFYFRLLTWRPSVWRRIVISLYVVGRFTGRWFDLLASGKTDLVVIEGQLFPYLPPLAERILARWQKFVIEFDDAIYLTSGHAEKIPVLLRLSTGAIVGNSTLAAYAESHSSNVYVVPTVVDTDRFSPRFTSPLPTLGATADLLTIGWIGLAYNASYLEWLRPVFLRLQQEFNLRLLVISSQPPTLDGVNVLFRPWSYETEVDDLRACEIGVMPLPDNEWARGKCGLKLLQYMAVGLASVATPLGVNRDIILDGVNGCLAATSEQWYTQLHRLCLDRSLRTRMGEVARKTVESQYALSVWGPRLLDLYKGFQLDEGRRALRQRNPASKAVTSSH